MSVYLIHFEPAYKHARHYLGFAEDVSSRYYAHIHGQGARLTQVASEWGCELILAQVWNDGTRQLERQLKKRHNAPSLCPICAARGRR